jgi:SMC interacting uncharacterized protein involved in chromosome segregation
MELLNDILKELKNQKAEIQSLRASTEELKKQVDSPKPINLDAEKIAKLLWTQFSPDLKEIQNKTSELQKVANSIPSTVNHTKTYGIEVQTKLWVLGLLVSGVFGFLIAPEIGQRIDFENKIKHLENHLQYHIDRNPTTEKKYQNQHN